MAIGAAIAATSVSWKPSWRIGRSSLRSWRLTWPVMKTAGVESKWQLPSAVSRLIAPGPLVPIATPGTPFIRACPSAAKPAACS